MGHYGEFPRPIPHLGVHSIALLTLSPLPLAGTFDLHVLGTPPAFTLSHDQTLQLNSWLAPRAGNRPFRAKSSRSNLTWYIRTHP